MTRIETTCIVNIIKRGISLYSSIFLNEVVMSEPLLNATQYLVDRRLLVLPALRTLEGLDAFAPASGGKMCIECTVWTAIYAVLGVVDLKPLPQVASHCWWI